MYIDKDLKVSTAQVIAVTAPSTDIIDQVAAGDAYEPCFLVVNVKEAFTAAGAGTLNIQIQTDDNSAFGSATTLVETGALALAALTLNAVAWKVRLPYGMERYIRVNYVVATGPMLTGIVDAFIVKDVNIG